jgi:hypothetical protein
MCAFGSDGAAVMLGKKTGVNVKLRQQVSHLVSPGIDHETSSYFCKHFLQVILKFLADESYELDTKYTLYQTMLSFDPQV